MIFIFIILCMMIGGCKEGNFFDIQSTMRPPKITGIESDIKNTVQQYTGIDVIWKYPRRGDYKSSIVLCDINGDGNDEAVVFYGLEEEKSGIYMMILHNVNGSWQVVNKFYNECYGIDKIIFEDLKGNNGKQLLVGYRLPDKVKNHLQIYDYDGNEYKELNNGYIYNDFSIRDFNKDAVNELMILATDLENYKTSCQLIKFHDDTIGVIDSLEIKREIIRYENMTSGKLNDSYEGIFLDYRKSDGSIETEVFFVDKEENKLKCMFTSNYTKRDIPLFCESITEDNIISIPIQVDMKLESDSKSSGTYMIEWSKFNKDLSKMYCEKESICNYNIGYNLFIPNNWKGRIEYEIGENLMHQIFNEICQDENGNVTHKNILELIKLNRNEWQSIEDKSKYTLIMQQNEFYYIAEIPDTESELFVSKDYIINNFSLLDSN